MSATIAIIVIAAEDTDAFESISLEDRKRESRRWITLDLRSGCFVDTFLQKATKVDLGVFGCENETDPETRGLLQTRLLTNGTVSNRLLALEKLVETDTDETAVALHKHGGGKGDLARITKALTSGKWPENGDPAEEAAAFAHELLVRARKAAEVKRGVCWEYRGDVTV